MLDVCLFQVQKLANFILAGYLELCLTKGLHIQFESTKDPVLLRVLFLDTVKML